MTSLSLSVVITLHLIVANERFYHLESALPEQALVPSKNLWTLLLCNFALVPIVIPLFLLSGKNRCCGTRIKIIDIVSLSVIT